MKVCLGCKVEKEEEFFHKNSKRGTQAHCKECRKAIDKAYWQKRSQDPQKMAEKKEYASSKREEARRFIYDYLLNHPCVDCREKDPVVLTFDHQRDKLFNVSSQISHGNLPKLIEEIAKCEVRCANCHMRKTAKDFNWYTVRYKNGM